MSFIRKTCSLQPHSLLKYAIRRGYTTKMQGIKNFKDFLASDRAATLPELPSTPPYILQSTTNLGSKNVYLETYGCQMNFNDSEIVLGVLKKSGSFVKVDSLDSADIVLLMTCAIRDNAEAKIWSRLESIHAHSNKRQRAGMNKITVGLLGCMAERLKDRLLEGRNGKMLIDIVCGPDAYRDLPRLLRDQDENADRINVMLSVDETYADISPQRLDPSKRSAWVSIMRGCNNMCAFCIVPFTRGRERSRSVQSIVEQVRNLSLEGVKEVYLLGQNVNSYCDQSEEEAYNNKTDDGGSRQTEMSKNFTTIYKPKIGGKRFVDLLDAVSAVDSEMRIRFTSPHPKDFPDKLLWLMRNRPNICNQIHLPAQSGSNQVLERMRRGYTREAYLDLVKKIRSILPKVSFSSDFIVGFCGESEADHLDTLALMKSVGYDMAYMFAYSMREKTMAHRRYKDDVEEEVKKRRLAELVRLFYDLQKQDHSKSLSKYELVLVEGPSKKNADELCGKSDGGRMIVFPKIALSASNISGSVDKRIPIPGDFVKVEILDKLRATPKAYPIEFSSITSFHESNSLNIL